MSPSYERMPVKWNSEASAVTSDMIVFGYLPQMHDLSALTEFHMPFLPCDAL